MQMGRCALGFIVGAIALASTGEALAGPIESFNMARVASGNPDRLVVRYQYGDGGMYYSEDGGASFDIGCFRPANPMVMDKQVQSFTVTNDGAVCIGTGKAVYCSNPQGCAWKEATELEGEWISDFAEDPIDSKVMYLSTSTASTDPMMPRLNGLWRRASPDAAWEKFGTALPGWFSRLFVVKNGEGRRFIVSAQETQFVTDPMTMAQKETVQYFIRYSDDEGVTWTSHAFDQMMDGSLRLIAVNPANPNEVAVMVRRAAPLTPDDLFVSPMLGMPGTYQKVASPTEIGGAVYTSDGKLYFGDQEQTTPGLFEVAKLGEMPKKLSEMYKVGCLTYDAASDRLYSCADWRFMLVDRTSGEFTTLFDMKNTATVHTCEGEPDLKESCAPALQSPNFCDISHFPMAPLCEMHFPATPLTGSAGAAGAAGASAGSAGAGGAAAVAGSSAAGNAATAAGAGSKSPGGPTPTDSPGGGCSTARGNSDGSALALLSLAALAAVLHRRRRRLPGADA